MPISEGGMAPAPGPRAEQLEDLYENAPCGYLSMQSDGRIFKINTTLSGWTGYTAEELMAKRLRDLVTVGTRVLFETHFMPLLHMQGFFDEGSFDLRTANGAIIAVSASGNIRKTADGEPDVFRLMFFKAKERRRYEQQLVDARERSQDAERDAQMLLEVARETAELREQFIAVLGHDLRNPLTSIVGGLQLLRRDLPEERRKRLLQMLDGSAVRMTDLIGNILDLARGRLGAGIPVDLQPNTEIYPILNQIVTELRLSVPDRVIVTDFNLLRPVKCDPSRIGQLVSNLLGNALTHGAPERPVRIHADVDDGFLTIWIANGGNQISSDAIERLFQPFFRGDVRDSQQGLGLGLYIAYEIAKSHAGTLAVNSTPEETRFTFRMGAIDG